MARTAAADEELGTGGDHASHFVTYTISQTAVNTAARTYQYRAWAATISRSAMRPPRKRKAATAREHEPDDEQGDHRAGDGVEHPGVAGLVGDGRPIWLYTYAWALIRASAITATRPRASAGVGPVAAGGPTTTAHWANTHEAPDADEHHVRRHLGDRDALGQPRARRRRSPARAAGSRRRASRRRASPRRRRRAPCRRGPGGAAARAGAAGRACISAPLPRRPARRSSTGSGDITVGTSAKLAVGAGDVVSHSSVWPPHGLSPTGVAASRAGRSTRPRNAEDDEEHQAVAGGDGDVPQLGRAARSRTCPTAAG